MEGAEMMDRETAIELADWLAHMQELGKKIAHLPEGREHVAKLALWEKTVREVAPMSDERTKAGPK
jgi:hypothetical protein